LAKIISISQNFINNTQIRSSILSQNRDKKAEKDVFPSLQYYQINQGIKGVTHFLGQTATHLPQAEHL